MSGWWARRPLRVSLVAVISAVLALGLLLAGLGAALALRSYLMQRLDADLTQAAMRYAQPVPGAPPVTELPPPPESGGETEPPQRFYIATVGADGAIDSVLSNPLQSGTPELTSLTPDELATRTPFTADTPADSWRVQLMPAGGGALLLVAASTAEVQSTVTQLVWLELGIGVMVVAVGAVVAYLLVRRVLRPLEVVERTSAQIAESAAGGDLSGRVPTTGGGSEVDQLAASFNTMVDRIEVAFVAQVASEQQARDAAERMRRFIADASHELRTPLTSVGGFAQLYRQGAVPEAGVADVMARIEQEAERMGVMVDDLLMLARLDQERPLQREPVDVGQVVAQAVAAAQAAAGTDRIRWQPQPDTDGEDDRPMVAGDEDRVRQVCDNLIGNALQHTPADSLVEVEVAVDADWVVVTVQDHGPGMTADVAAQVFDRFYRADSSRTRASGGAGLGLAIVQALVAAHGGTVDLVTSPGQGARFTVRLHRLPEQRQ